LVQSPKSRYSPEKYPPKEFSPSRGKFNDTSDHLSQGPINVSKMMKSGSRHELIHNVKKSPKKVETYRVDRNMVINQQRNHNNYVKVK
jgi:hypothetical protein